MIVNNAVVKAYMQFELKKWDKLYVALDIHDTVTRADYEDVSEHLYVSAIEPLAEVSKLPEVEIILFSSCYPKDYQAYIEMFARHGVKISNFNANPEVGNTKTGCFDSKFYYNVLVDDKAGFEPWMFPSLRDAFMNARQFNKRVIELYGRPLVYKYHNKRSKT